MNGIENINSIIPPTEKISSIESNESNVKISKLLNDEDMEQIERKMLEKFGPHKWGLRDSTEYARNVTNESKYFLEGTLNLIEKVVDGAKSGEGYDTLIFLDKSARPGSYLYREMVDMLEKKGFIDSNLNLPEIKFMDIGKRAESNKVRSEFTKSIVKEKIKPESLGKKVLVVDEFEDTGATLKNALTEIKNVYDSDIEGFIIDGAYQFNQKRIAPFFYLDSQLGASLVRDAELGAKIKELDRGIITGNFSEIVSKRDGISNEDWSALDDVMSYKSLAEELPREVFIDVVELPEDGFGVDKMIERIRLYKEDFDVDSIVEDLNAVYRTSIKALPRQVYDYFKYAGGRLSAPLVNDRNLGLNLREMFKHLVYLSSEVINKSE